MKNKSILNDDGTLPLMELYSRRNEYLRAALDAGRCVFVPMKVEGVEMRVRFRVEDIDGHVWVLTYAGPVGSAHPGVERMALAYMQHPTNDEIEDERARLGQPPLNPNYWKGMPRNSVAEQRNCGGVVFPNYRGR